MRTKNNLSIIRKYLVIFIVLFSKMSFALNQNFSYFGYYWGMDGLSAVGNNINTMLVSNQYNATDVNDLAQKDITGLISLNNQGAKGIVDVSSVFFDLSKNDGSGHFPLRGDWETRFNTYWKLIYPYLSLIRAFYPIDEPDVSVNSADYAKATHIIKINVDTTQFSIPILMVITASGVVKLSKGSLTVPPEVNWMGFDEYGCWGSECYAGLSIPQKLNIVDSVMSPRGGKVIVVSDGVIQGTTTPTPEQQDALVNRSQDYVSLCNSTTNCVGMFVFLWQSMKEQELIGVSSMPTLQSYLNGL